MSVSSYSALPSRFAIQSASPCLVVRPKRSFVESGDHTGNPEMEPSLSDVTSFRPVPSGCTTHTWGLARSLLVNAISWPSGDHCAETAPRPYGVIWRKPEPSAFTTYRAIPRPGDDLHWAAKVTCDP